MESKYIENILQNKNKFVFLGESGSGKSEIAINFTKKIMDITKKKITFFDLDQTKTIYRSRDFKEILNNKKVSFIYGEQFQDSPIVPHGVCNKLENEDEIVILDVGGNKVGALTLGQFSKYLNDDKTIVFYSINPYRSFSDSKNNILNTMYHIKSASNIENIKILSNPNIGLETNVDIVVNGDKNLKSILSDLNQEVLATVVPNWINKDKLTGYNMNLFTVTPCVSFL